MAFKKRRKRKSRKNASSNNANTGQTVMQKLDEAEGIWRDATETEYPLFSGIKINKTVDPAQASNNELFWSFSIDMNGETMNTLVFQPELVYEQFLKRVLPMYSKHKKKLHRFSEVYGLKMSGTEPIAEECIENILLDTMVYLHFHELEHPMDAPYSQDDRAKIEVAIFDGIRKAIPGIKKSEALKKAANARNLVLDMIDDNKFYARLMDWTGEGLEETLEKEFLQRNRTIGSEKITKMPDGVITTWDVIEMARGEKKIYSAQDAEMMKSSAVYSLSRIPYVMMYVDDSEIREAQLELFVEHLNNIRLNDENVEKRLNMLYKLMVKEQKKEDLDTLGIDTNSYYQAVDIMLGDIKDEDYLESKELVCKTIHELFNSNQTRYTAVSAYIMPFADLLSSKTSSGRGGTAGSCPGTDASSMLDNILDSLDQDEANELLQELAQENSTKNRPNPGSVKKPGKGKGSEKNDSGNNQSPNSKLPEKAFFEYYRKNSNKLEIYTPTNSMKTRDVGRDTYVELESSRTLTMEELFELDMTSIAEQQEEIGYDYPILVKLNDFTWQLNEYKRVEDTAKVHTLVSKGIDMPDNLVLIVDSSGSMGSGNYMGTGDKYDMLCKVTHGLLQGLQKAAKITGKKTNVKIINFSNGTYSSDFEELELAYKPGSQTMQMLHAFEGGGTDLDTTAIEEAEKSKKKGNTLYAIITDGGFTGGQLQDPSLGAIYLDNLIGKDGNALAFIEIQSKTTLGSKLEDMQQTRNNLKYASVDKVEDITKELGSVLIQYRR